MQQQDYSDVYQKRKHKLFRALADHKPNASDSTSPRQHLLALLAAIQNKDNNISQLDYLLKHQFDCDLTPHTTIFMDLMWEVMEQRSGALISFVVYRLCRKYPDMYWKVQQWLERKMQNMKWNLNQLIFVIDIYLYGWPMTLETFNGKIFPKFRQHLVMLIPKYYLQLANSVHFPIKQQKMFKSTILGWLEDEKQQLVTAYESLAATSLQLQHSIVDQLQNQAQLNSYEYELEEYDTSIHRFQLASQCMGVSFDSAPFKLKTIFQLKRQCQHFKKLELSPYERSLYTRFSPPFELKPLKKHEMLKLEDNDAFIVKIKLCSKLEECVDLAGYFLEQMNLQSNREYLIENIINQCANYNNLSYILKILFEIGSRETSIKDYCNTKARKICSANRINPKYHKLLCQMGRFGLIDEKILIDYCEHILRIENNQVTRQIQSILEHLGTIVYYRNLSVHIRINNLFQKIEHIIKNKMTHFNMQHLYQLKGMVNYLRNHTKTAVVAQTHELAKVDIKHNFDFILSKMQKKLKEKEENYILEYMVCGIDSEVYLTTYFYASLLRELNSKELNKQIHNLTVETIRNALREGNCQKAVRWSRLLGELYNYECMSRKSMLNELEQLLAVKDEEVAGRLKCVCAALDTARTYLQQVNPKKQRQTINLLLKLKRAYLEHREILEYSLNCQILDIIEYFNPQLLIVLNESESIEKYLKAESQLSQTHACHASQIISMLAQGYSIEQIEVVNHEGTSPDSKKKYKEKESTSQKSDRKWGEKPVYIQKKVQTIQAEKETRKENQSRQSSNTLESTTIVRKMKVMGRSKKQNKIKTISCTVTDTQPQN